MHAWWIAVAALAGCAHAVVRAAPPRVVSDRPAAPGAAPPTWPVPMRVMTWTPAGLVQIGTLPAAPAPVPPTTPWYVEPTEALDAAAFARVVIMVRREHVPGLSLRGQRVAAELGALRDLPDLTALVLDDSDVDGPALAGMQLALQRLSVARTAVDEASLVALLAHQPDLVAVSVEEDAVGDPTARALAALPGLVAVNLASTHVTDLGGAALGALAKLQIVDLGHTRVGAQTIVALRPLALRQLFLDHTNAGPELATLGGYAPGLERFDVSSLAAYHPTDGDLAWLARAPHVVELGLSGAKIHDRLALTLVQGAALRELRLAETPIGVATIRAIAARHELEELDLGDTPVDDASAAAILAFPHLRVLRLDHTPVTDAALAATPSPDLVELYLSRTVVGDAGLAILAATPRLTGLGLGDTHIGDATLARIAALTELRTLVLTQVRAEGAGLAAVAALPHLERLYLDETRADDSTVEALAPAHALTVLHVGATNVSDASLPRLRAQTRLAELAIGDTRMTAAVTDVSAWPRLATLSLLGLALDDAAVSRLAAAPALDTLDLSATDIRDPAALLAAPALHTLGVAQTHLTPAGRRTVGRLAARGVAIVR